MTATGIQRELGQIIAERPVAASLLMRLGIDPNRHAGQPFDAVCRDAGIEPAAVLDLILTDLPEPGAFERDWSIAGLDDLTDHVVAVHHQYLLHKLPELRLLLAKATHDEPSRETDLDSIAELVDRLDRDLRRYLDIEASVLFPLIREMVWSRKRSRSADGKFDRAIRDVNDGYNDVAAAMAELRRTTGHFHAPDDACTAHQSLIEQLAELDGRLQRQAHLEVEVLFPRAMELETDLGW